MNLLKQIETLFTSGTASGLTDGQLLERFVERRDEGAEAAFAALVDRHGAMVLRVCRQVLGDEHDAQDASQATFLVLARRAGSIGQRESVASWLHGVALRVAARARLAAARRRARERRGGEIMTARQVDEIEVGNGESPDRYAELHNELNRLPESFRQPLVLCYLEGLTQEQAAAQLRCPLGTVQSRLARGRAKLKLRLARRGVDLSALLPEARLWTSHAAPAPAAWAGETVRLATHLTQAKGSGAAAAAVALAEEVLRTMIVAKVKLAVATLLGVALLASAAATWARQGRDEPVAVNVAGRNARPEPPPAKAPRAGQGAARIVHGIVRDEQGRPVAKAWIGEEVRRRPDQWEVVDPPESLRECQEPYRDERGKVVSPGKIGKYFELRDAAGTWRPIHPDDIGRREDISSRRSPADPELPEPANAALTAKGGPVFLIRKSKGLWAMVPLDFHNVVADRTGPQGQFSVEPSFVGTSAYAEIQFASPDFSLGQIYGIRDADPDRPVEIILKPLREVHARVIVTSRDEPNEAISCYVYSVDSGHGTLEDYPAIGAPGVCWGRFDVESPPADRSLPGARRLDVRLPAGRFKLRFQSDTVYRIVDLIVPSGDGPLELPDIRLEPLGWAKMLGRAAAEIEAVDLEGQPVKLADYRGKVVILAFFSTENAVFNQTVPLLTEVQRRFGDKRLATLALHDAIVTSLAKLKKNLEPVRAQIAGENSIRFLLDRPPAGDRTGASTPRPGEARSGRTTDVYECDPGSLLVIDEHGKLVRAIVTREWGDRAAFAIGKGDQLVRQNGEEPLGNDERLDRTFTLNTIEDTVEDLLGLPRSVKPALKVRQNVIAFEEPPKGPLGVTGKLIDLDGRPVVGAKIILPRGFAGPPPAVGAEIEDEPILKEAQTVISGPAGEFRFTSDRPESQQFTIRANGLATRTYSLVFSEVSERAGGALAWLHVEPSGKIPRPVRLSPGATVTGRVVRDGKPLAGVTMRIGYSEACYGDCSGSMETQSDEHGSFQFRHVLPETTCWAYAKLGSLDNAGAIGPVTVPPAADNATVDLGDLRVEKGCWLSGRLVLSDGNVPRRGTKVTLTVPHTEDSLTREVDETGRFDFQGIPASEVFIDVFLLVPRRSRSIDYHLSSKNKCRDPVFTRMLKGRLDRDITDLTILFEPGMESRARRYSAPDPAVVADFNDAKAGPITGVPPVP